MTNVKPNLIMLGRILFQERLTNCKNENQQKDLISKSKTVKTSLIIIKIFFAQLKASS